MKSLGDILRLSTEFLAAKGSPSANADAQWLIGHALQLKRLELFMQADRPLSPQETESIRTLLRRRAAGEPVQYICGSTSFYGIEIAIGPGVLVPRPETEELVSHARRLLRPGAKMIDLCTGSACIPVALQAQFQRSLLCQATDLSPEALAYAKRNVERHCPGAVTLIQGDLFAGIDAQADCDLITANPPYIALHEKDLMDPSVLSSEPHLALFSGADGLDLIRRLLSQSRAYLRPGAHLLCEIGFRQGPAVAELAAGNGFCGVRILKDLAGSDRILLAQAPP